MGSWPSTWDPEEKAGPSRQKGLMLLQVFGDRLMLRLRWASGELRKCGQWVIFVCM